VNFDIDFTDKDKCSFVFVFYFMKLVSQM